MPTLKAKKKTIIEVNYSDLDDYISAMYEQEYESAPDMEVSNDTKKSFNVSKREMSDYDKKRLDQFKLNGEGNYLLQTILLDLCNNGHLPECELYVEFSW